jgi:adenine-specific DNA-methyltransferase
MGSGSTGRAAVAEGFRFIGIEKEAEYVEIARKRVLPSYNDFFG